MTLRKTTRRPRRHTTRMLNGARREPPTNWLGLASQALSEAIRIDNRLQPHMAEQKHMLEEYWRLQEREAALHKIYGPWTSRDQKPRHFVSTPTKPAELMKQELALLKTQARIAKLESKLSRRQ